MPWSEFMGGTGELHGQQECPRAVGGGAHVLTPARTHTVVAGQTQNDVGMDGADDHFGGVFSALLIDHGAGLVAIMEDGARGASQTELAIVGEEARHQGSGQPLATVLDAPAAGEGRAGEGGVEIERAAFGAHRQDAGGGTDQQCCRAIDAAFGEDRGHRKRLGVVVQRCVLGEP